MNKMDLSIIIIGLILLALFLVPVVIAAKSGNNKKS